MSTRFARIPDSNRDLEFCNCPRAAMNFVFPVGWIRNVRDIQKSVNTQLNNIHTSV